MSYMKRFLEQVMAEMGKDDINDPEVLAEAQRRLDAHEVIFFNPRNPQPYQNPLPGLTFDPHDEEDEEDYPLDGEGFGHHC